MKKYKVAVIIGRYQIPHTGHELLKRRALEIAEQVIVIIGSSFQARNPRNPFRWQERRDMILSTLTADEKARTHCLPISDYYNDERWQLEVKHLVSEYSKQEIILVGHKKAKDKDTYYLDNFVEWAYMGLESAIQINASELRAIYFEAKDLAVSLATINDFISPPVQQFLKTWALKSEYSALVKEHNTIKEQQALWHGSPYPVIFSTADAIVTINKHVLLGKRKYYPGKGLWAIPGGFVEKGESVLNAALRELKEETQIELSTKTLLNNLKSVSVFDHPKRSCRGRIITHAHFFELAQLDFPDLKAADDLQVASWVPIKKLNAMEEQLFEDHFHILNTFLAFKKESTAF